MKKLFFVVTVLCIAILSSCASAPNTSTRMGKELEDAPKWVLASPSTETEICGVGSAAGSRNPSLMRTTAMGRARTEISRTLSTKVTSMLKDYQSTTTGGEEFGNAANDEQHVEDVSKQITKNTLSGTELKDTWVSNTGTLYTLVCVDLEKFKDSVNKMNQLSENVRKAVVERAEKSFKELDKETK